MITTLVILLVVALAVLAIWVVAELKDAAYLRARMGLARRGREDFWKTAISVVIRLERRVWRLTGIRLPMYRRRFVHRCRETQRLLNKEHGTNIAYPMPSYAKR